MNDDPAADPADPDRCTVAYCDGRLRRGYRAALDDEGDVEPAAWCSRCGHLAY